MRAKKYIQSHTIDTPLNDGLKESRGMQLAYDGVAEVWFESEEDLMAAMSSEAGLPVKCGVNLLVVIHGIEFEEKTLCDIKEYGCHIIHVMV